MKRIFALVPLCLAALLLLPACRGAGAESSSSAKPVIYLYPEEETEPTNSSSTGFPGWGPIPIT